MDIKRKLLWLINDKIVDMNDYSDQLYESIRKIVVDYEPDLEELAKDGGSIEEHIFKDVSYEIENYLENDAYDEISDRVEPDVYNSDLLDYFQENMNSDLSTFIDEGYTDFYEMISTHQVQSRQEELSEFINDFKEEFQKIDFEETKNLWIEEDFEPDISDIDLEQNKDIERTI